MVPNIIILTIYVIATVSWWGLAGMSGYVLEVFSVPWYFKVCIAALCSSMAGVTGLQGYKMYQQAQDRSESKSKSKYEEEWL